MENIENKEEIVEKRKDKVELNYYRARFTQKCGAILLDVFTYALLVLAIFIGLQAIVRATPKYQEISVKFDEAKLNSSLYVENKSLDRIEDVVTYLNRDDTKSAKEQEDYLLDHIYQFFDTLPSEKVELVKEYEDFITKTEFKYEGHTYFVRDENNEIIKNPEYYIPISAYVENIYKPYIDNIALAQFLLKTPNVMDYQKYQSDMVLYLEIPLSVVLGAIIVWYIIPLCFYRGKKTLGRFAFRIGLVGSDYLSLRFGKFTIRFLIFLFFELILSIFTFCIPLIISISMSAFNKNKQNFHDYMLGIYEIDTYGTKLYRDGFEIQKDFYKKEVVDFKQK